jgi:hypothetical protein
MVRRSVAVGGFSSTSRSKRPGRLIGVQMMIEMMIIMMIIMMIVMVIVMVIKMVIETGDNNSTGHVKYVHTHMWVCQGYQQVSFRFTVHTTHAYHTWIPYMHTIHAYHTWIPYMDTIHGYYTCIPYMHMCTIRISICTGGQDQEHWDGL